MRRAGLLLVLPVVAVLSGCIVVAAAGAGAAGVVWYRGAAEKSYPTGVIKTYDVTLEVLKANDIVVYEKGADATSGHIEGTLANGKKIKLDLSATGENVTKVKIRIGTWGDKDKTLFLFQKLDDRLK